jgi:hypothetical protein
MKHFSLIALLLLPSCAQDIAGLTPAQRDGIYSMAAVMSGRPELVPVIYGAPESGDECQTTEGGAAMSALQISAYALGFAFFAVVLLVWLVLALDRAADRDAEERRERKRREGKKLP